MKIPVYVENALQKRIKGASMIMDADTVISQFIDENNIEVPFEDYHGGAEIYSNPYRSAESIRQCILNHKK